MDFHMNELKRQHYIYIQLTELTELIVKTYIAERLLRYRVGFNDSTGPETSKGKKPSDHKLAKMISKAVDLLVYNSDEYICDATNHNTQMMNHEEIFNYLNSHTSVKLLLDGKFSWDGIAEVMSMVGEICWETLQFVSSLYRITEVTNWLMQLLVYFPLGNPVQRWIQIVGGWKGLLEHTGTVLRGRKCRPRESDSNLKPQHTSESNTNSPSAAQAQPLGVDNSTTRPELNRSFVSPRNRQEMPSTQPTWVPSQRPTIPPNVQQFPLNRHQIFSNVHQMSQNVPHMPQKLHQMSPNLHQMPPNGHQMSPNGYAQSPRFRGHFVFPEMNRHPHSLDMLHHHSVGFNGDVQSPRTNERAMPPNVPLMLPELNGHRQTPGLNDSPQCPMMNEHPQAFGLNQQFLPPTPNRHASYNHYNQPPELGDSPQGIPQGIPLSRTQKDSTRLRVQSILGLPPLGK